MFSGCTSNDNASKTVKISVDDVYETVINAEIGTKVEWNWKSDRKLAFLVLDAPNVIIDASSTTSDEGSFDSKSDGKYTFQWQNTNDFVVELTYEIQYEKM